MFLMVNILLGLVENEYFCEAKSQATEEKT